MDGVIGSVKTQSTSQSAALSSTSPQTQVSEVNVIQSTPSQQTGGKKKEKNKPKNTNNNEQPKNQAQTPATEKKPQWKLKFPCIICGDNHYTRDFPHRDEVAKLFQGNSQPAMLTHPHDEASTSAHIYMFNGINLTTRSKTYDTPAKPEKTKVTNGSLLDPSTSSVSPPSVSPPYGPLHIEKPSFESILRPPKSTIRKYTFNPSSHAAHNYNIVEDLAQAPCAMFALEVL
jgi:hypothetical protein